MKSAEDVAQLRTNFLDFLVLASAQRVVASARRSSHLACAAALENRTEGLAARSQVHGSGERSELYDLGQGVAGAGVSNKMAPGISSDYVGSTLF